MIKTFPLLSMGFILSLSPHDLKAGRVVDTAHEILNPIHVTSKFAGKVVARAEPFVTCAEGKACIKIAKVALKVTEETTGQVDAVLQKNKKSIDLAENLVRKAFRDEEKKREAERQFVREARLKYFLGEEPPQKSLKERIKLGFVRLIHGGKSRVNPHVDNEMILAMKGKEEASKKSVTQKKRGIFSLSDFKDDNLSKLRRRV